MTAPTSTTRLRTQIAAASVPSWVLAFQGVPDRVVETMQGLTRSPCGFLLRVIVLPVLLGLSLRRRHTPLPVKGCV